MKFFFTDTCVNGHIFPITLWRDRFFEKFAKFFNAALNFGRFIPITLWGDNFRMSRTDTLSNEGALSKYSGDFKKYFSEQLNKTPHFEGVLSKYSEEL